MISLDAKLVRRWQNVCSIAIVKNVKGSLNARASGKIFEFLNCANTFLLIDSNYAKLSNCKTVELVFLNIWALNITDIQTDYLKMYLS